MPFPHDHPADSAKLRRCAEPGQRSRKPEEGGLGSELETGRIVHELQGHPIELEMQNEEFRQVRAREKALLARYTDLYDFAPVGYVTFDREGVIRQLNLTGARLLGAERSGLVNQRFGLYVAENDRHAFNGFLDKVFTVETKEGCEVTLLQAGQHFRFVRIEGTRTADGQEFRAVMLDRTEHRQAQEAARAAQAEMQRRLALSDQSRRALLSAAEDERNAAEALILQARIATLFLTVPDDQIFSEVLEVILDVMHSPFGVFGFLDEDGALVVPAMAPPIENQGETPEKMPRFPRETWEEEPIPAKMEPVRHALLGDSVWHRALREKRTILSNEPFARGPNDRADIPRQISLPIVFQGEVIGLFRVANPETSYTEADLRRFEAIAGHVAPPLSARLRRERAQQALRTLNAELEQRVRDRTAQLEVANKELETFSYSVSHDLRAPLRAIHGFVRILSEDYTARLDDEGRRVLGTIYSEAERMGQLIDDLLSFSRMSRQHVESEPIDMTALAQAAFDGCAAHAPGRRLEFKAQPLPPAQGDGALLRQVFVNLFSNAIKYTRPRPVAEIEIGGREEGPENLYYVRDNGVGFDMKYAGKLFGVFQRLHTEDEFEGTGVGLALVQRVIRRHGGRVWAEAKLNEGSTFYFTIPIRRDT